MEDCEFNNLNLLSYEEYPPNPEYLVSKRNMLRLDTRGYYYRENTAHYYGFYSLNKRQWVESNPGTSTGV